MSGIVGTGGPSGVFDTIRRAGVVPIVTIGDVRMAVPLGEALVAADLPIVEITARTEAAFAVVDALVDAVSGLTVGMGTLLDAQAARLAIEAGSSFLVSPGLSPDVVEVGEEAGIPAIPGVFTPTEVMQARRIGCTVVKLFPAGGAAGVERVVSFGSVFPDIGFVPTGGIDLKILPDYLARPNVVACGGSWIAPRAAIAAGAFDEIRDRAAEARATVRSVRSAE